jgi:acyl-CoA synthetase (AMP-forming)/AMP-acid ligase II
MNIAEILRQQAQERPDAIAIFDTALGRDRGTTFAELERQSAQAAQLLRQCGLHAGDAVLIFYPMSAELYIALLALFRLGLVAMFLDPGAGPEYIERCCARCGPRALIASTKTHLLCLLSPALRGISIKFVIGWPLPRMHRWISYRKLRPEADALAVEPDAPALLTFTSGSTGQPKAVVRTHDFLLVQHQVLAKSLELRAGDVDLTTLPVVMLANLATGMTSVIPNADLRYPGAVDAGPILAQIERHRVTRSVASPAFFECLVQGAARQQRSLMGLEKLFAGGAAVFPYHMEKMQQLAPNAEVVAVYGSTEAEPIAHVCRREISAADHQAMLAGQGLLAGKPIVDIDLRILRGQWGTPVGRLSREQFATLCQSTNQPGEIVVTGRHVLKRYWYGHGEAETKFQVDGVIWHRTGDAGYLDAEGRVWLLGRCAARIQDDRGELYPFAVEAVAYHDPHVRRAALIQHQGKRVLVVEYHAGQPGDVQQLRRQLEWAGIDAIQVRRHIPVDKRHNAKIDYTALQRLMG